MKIAFVLRSDFRRSPGGDVTQAFSLMKELQKSGHHCAITTSESDFSDYDIVHIFNSARIHSAYYTISRLRDNGSGAKVVYSPIWHPMSCVKGFYYASSLVRSLGIERYFGLKELYYERMRGGRTLARVAMDWRSCLQFCVDSADLIMPNSGQELRDLCAYLHLDAAALDKKSCVVKNATAVAVSAPAPSMHKENLIVCAGRIEPRKNQLAVARAFLSDRRLDGYSLVFAGAVSRKHFGYTAEIKRLCGDRIRLAGHLNRPELDQLFSNAKVCVLASHFETTGLVGLEAAVKGNAVVMTTNSYNDEYYGSHAFYCDPRSEKSIADAIYEALASIDSGVPVSIDWVHQGGFTWPEAAALTAEGYLSVLASSPASDYRGKSGEL